MPISVVIRDVLGYARSTREVRHILHNGHALIDGRVCKDVRRGVGLMDVLTLGEDNFRCVLDHNGRLRYRPISAEEAGWKVCRIEGKSTIKGGKTQFNFTMDVTSSLMMLQNTTTGSSLNLLFQVKRLSNTSSFVEGVSLLPYSVVLTLADLLKMKAYDVKRSSMPNEVQFDDFGTIASNVFAVGDAHSPNTEVVE